MCGRGKAERERRELLDEQDADALGGDVAQRRNQPAHDDWGQSERKLVDDQILGVAHDRLGEGKHLLLAAGQGSSAVVAQIAKLAEDPVYSIERRSSCAAR